VTAGERKFGPWAYGHAASDVFVDPQRGIINLEYFRPYFDDVSLPIDVAKAALGDHYSQYQAPEKGCIRFVPLSVLGRHRRIPSYDEMRDALVDHPAIEGFTLSGPLSMWTAPNLFKTSPCVFVSHRWQSPDEPDPDGARLDQILERLNALQTRGRLPSGDEVFLWIDYCCLPQRRGTKALPAEDQAALQAGLAYLPEIVKSCDLMILESADYMGRVWCYTELLVWLTKLIELQEQLFGQAIFSSALSRRAQTTPDASTTKVTSSHDFVRDNAVFRGYPGTVEELTALYAPIFDYVTSAKESASYNLGAYEGEYVPELIAFMCNSWYLLQQKKCAVREDIDVCLRIIVRALTFSNHFGY
jgi:hypothetical protein